MKLRDNWEEYLRNPPPGSKAFEAKEYGIDMEELIENLKLTPEERLRKLQVRINEAEEAKKHGITHGFYPVWDLSRRPK